MNHEEFCLQGVPFLDRELYGGQNNERSGEEIVGLMILKWNMRAPVAKRCNKNDYPPSTSTHVLHPKSYVFILVTIAG